MQQIGAKLGPALVRLEGGIAIGFGVQLGTHTVERQHAGVATAHDVQRGQVQWQTHQVVTQSVGDPHVNAHAHLRRTTGGELGRGGFVVSQGVQERLDQAHVTQQVGFDTNQARGSGRARGCGAHLDDHSCGIGDADHIEGTCQLCSCQPTKARDDTGQVDFVGEIGVHDQVVVGGKRHGDQLAARACGQAGDVGDALQRHGFGQHGVAKTVNRVGKLGCDGRVKVDVVGRKCGDVGAEFAHKLTEDQVLVFHFGDQFGGLEHHLAGPDIAEHVGVELVEQFQTACVVDRCHTCGVFDRVDGGDHLVQGGAVGDGDG